MEVEEGGRGKGGVNVDGSIDKPAVKVSGNEAERIQRIKRQLEIRVISEEEVKKKAKR